MDYIYHNELTNRNDLLTNVRTLNYSQKTRNELRRNMLYLQTSLQNRFAPFPIADDARYARVLNENGVYYFDHRNHVNNTPSRFNLDMIQDHYYYRDGSHYTSPDSYEIKRGKKNVNNINNSENYTPSLKELNSTNVSNSSQIKHKVIYDIVQTDHSRNHFYNMATATTANSKTKELKSLNQIIPNTFKEQAGDKIIKLLSRIPNRPQEGLIPLPVPDDHRLVTIRAYDNKTNKYLKKGIDYELIQNTKKSGLLIKINNPYFSQNPISFDLSFKESSPTFKSPLKQKKLNLKLNKLLPILNQISLLGFRGLEDHATPQDIKLKDKLFGATLSVSELEQLIKQHTTYSCTATQAAPYVIDGFTFFSRFIKKGKFHGQCDSINLLLKQILEEYYKNDKSVTVMTRKGFNPKGKTLATTDHHAQTVVKIKQDFYLFDATATQHDGTIDQLYAPHDQNQHKVVSKNDSLDQIAKSQKEIQSAKVAESEKNIFDQKTKKYLAESDDLKSMILKNFKNASGRNTRLKPTLQKVYQLYSFFNNYLKNEGSYTPLMDMQLKKLRV